MSITDDLTLDQGTEKVIEYTIYNGSVAPANLVNLTGYTSQFTISDKLTKKALLTVSGTMGGATGKINIAISAANSSTIKFVGDKLNGVYQLDLTLPDSTIRRIFSGALVINRKISQ